MCNTYQLTRILRVTPLNFPFHTGFFYLMIFTFHKMRSFKIQTKVGRITGTTHIFFRGPTTESTNEIQRFLLEA